MEICLLSLFIVVLPFLLRVLYIFPCFLPTLISIPFFRYFLLLFLLPFSILFSSFISLPLLFLFLLLPSTFPSSPFISLTHTISQSEPGTVTIINKNYVSGLSDTSLICHATPVSESEDGSKITKFCYTVR